jgi:hypothetical protein
MLNLLPLLLCLSSMQGGTSCWRCVDKAGVDAITAGTGAQLHHSLGMLLVALLPCTCFE